MVKYALLEKAKKSRRISMGSMGFTNSYYLVNYEQIIQGQLLVNQNQK